MDCVAKPEGKGQAELQSGLDRLQGWIRRSSGRVLARAGEDLPADEERYQVRAVGDAEEEGWQDGSRSVCDVFYFKRRGWIPAGVGELCVWKCGTYDGVQ